MPKGFPTWLPSDQNAQPPCVWWGAGSLLWCLCCAQNGLIRVGFHDFTNKDAVGGDIQNPICEAFHDDRTSLNRRRGFYYPVTPKDFIRRKVARLQPIIVTSWLPSIITPLFDRTSKTRGNRSEIAPHSNSQQSTGSVLVRHKELVNLTGVYIIRFRSKCNPRLFISNCSHLISRRKRSRLQ